MKLLSKILITLTVMFVLFACGKKEQVFLEKDGTLYEIADQVSFYYPTDFSLSTTAVDDTTVVSFVNDNNEVFSYTTIQDDTDNEVNDMPELYAGQLEEDGAINVTYYNVELDSGLTCYSFEGINANGLYFNHMVYFTNNVTYDYSYSAPKDVYTENQKLMNQFLRSLTVHGDNAAAVDK